MDWTQAITIISINVALVGIMSTLIVWAINKTDNDVKKLGSQVDGIANRLDSHAQRIDQLYRMFVDLLKK